jgi:hypothetical protein
MADWLQGQASGRVCLNKHCNHVACCLHADMPGIFRAEACPAPFCTARCSHSCRSWLPLVVGGVGAMWCSVYMATVASPVACRLLMHGGALQGRAVAAGAGLHLVVKRIEREEYGNISHAQTCWYSTVVRAQHRRRTAPPHKPDREQSRRSRAQRRHICTNTCTHSTLPKTPQQKARQDKSSRHIGTALSASCANKAAPSDHISLFLWL